MDTSNFNDKQSKHPIPHAEGVVKDDNLQPKSVDVNSQQEEE
ncbi:MAG: hypothetical protein WBA16_03080 [Nonlabens sp.]